MTHATADDMLRPLGPTALAPFARTPDDALADVFGHASFRSGQRRAIDHMMAGKDALVVMPTGAGKSLCYQLTAALTQGLTVVVSPLIALMKDQVDALAPTGLPATAIHSSMSRTEQQRRIEGMYVGDYKIVFVSPERFRNSTFCQALEDVEIGLFAIDEAHCISQWGHDFRPAYRQLADVRQRFGWPQTLALTATATEFVQRDITAQLGIDADDVFVSGFERPNLYFEVFDADGKRDKLRRLAGVIDDCAGESAIVYAATRKQVKSVHSHLDKAGVDPAIYHGGLAAKRRVRAHDAWKCGDRPVLVATNAFGMGVDKADVRAVVHYNMPGSLEAYYQEAGRAGRDGRPATCLLMFNRGDTRIHTWFADNSYPLRMQAIRVWLYLQTLDDGPHPLSNADIAKAARGPKQKMHPMVVGACLRLMSRAGHIRRRGGAVEVVDDVSAVDLRIDFDGVQDQRHHAKQQMSQMVDYATARGCYQKVLLDHFGDAPSFGDQCGHCAGCA